MKYIKAITLVLIIASCQNNGSNEQDLVKNNTDDTIKNYNQRTDPAESKSSCYESANGNDTVFLSIFSESKVITGSLLYNYYQKDKNRGTIRGRMHGDTLIADYVFMSEGKASVRQVAFLKQDNSFIEGYGDATEENGKMVFKNRTMLNFTGRPLVAVDCERR